MIDSEHDATPTTKPVVWGNVLTTHSLDSERNLWVIRLILPPGAELPYWTRPSLTTIYVESGLLVFTGVTGIVRLSRGVNPVEHTTTVTGQPTKLAPGDTVSFSQGVQHSMYNPVLTPTAIIVTMIAASAVVPYDGLWTSEGYPIQIDA
jgi:quercetin dioxygenase-like cupin family protein